MPKTYPTLPGSNAQDLTGERFGRLVVVGFSNWRYHGKTRHAVWTCRCDCGTVKTVESQPLKNGRTQSCKCLLAELSSLRAYKHGGEPKRLYRVWQSMKSRCYREKTLGFHNYGGRGILVCDEWKTSYEAFRDWAFANGWMEGLEIDRIDVNGNYEPDNCRWVDDKEQAQNKRGNRRLLIDGEEKCLSEWAAISGNSQPCIRYRLEQGWEPSLAVFTPPQGRFQAGVQSHFVTLNGESKTIAEWSEITGIKASTLQQRLVHGWSDEDALTTPVVKRQGSKPVVPRVAPIDVASSLRLRQRAITV